MIIRLLLTTQVHRPTSDGGYTYEHIHYVGEYDKRDWSSKSAIRRSFRNKARKLYPHLFLDPTMEIKEEDPPLTWSQVDSIARDEKLPMKERAAVIRRRSDYMGYPQDFAGMSDEDVVREWLA